MIVVGWLIFYTLYSLLQHALRERRQHEDDCRHYDDAMRGVDQWLAQAQIEVAGEPMVTYEVNYLRKQLHENEVSLGYCLLQRGHNEHVPISFSYFMLLS